MANRSDVRANAKILIGRNYTGIDTDLNTMIDLAVELFGNTISAVYDEYQWSHTITQAEVDANTDNWQLPGTTKHLLDATIIDNSGTEKVYHTIRIKSPLDWWSLDDLDDMGYGFVTPPSFDYSVEEPRRPYLNWRVGRTDRTGIPRFCTKLGNSTTGEMNVHVFPRPGDSEVNYLLRLMLAVRPATLTADSGEGSTNSITNKYPLTLATYISALLFGLRVGDDRRAVQFLNQSALLMQAFATQNEISKLMNILLTLKS